MARWRDLDDRELLEAVAEVQRQPGRRSVPVSGKRPLPLHCRAARRRTAPARSQCDFQSFMSPILGHYVAQCRSHTRGCLPHLSRSAARLIGLRWSGRSGRRVPVLSPSVGTVNTSRGDTGDVCRRRCAPRARSDPALWPVTVSGPCAVETSRRVAHAARAVQSTVQWPGAGTRAGSAWEPPDALTAAVSAQRIRVSAVSGCSP